jgi:hypothetical protein
LERLAVLDRGAVAIVAAHGGSTKTRDLRTASSTTFMLKRGSAATFLLRTELDSPDRMG